mmetsp:Transcript_2636/g.5840  ORF Transcript_2636/g.5840 Transcript_2636/m.5840 type:complete len:207 (-) Transcript_2636:972-1592(-)
MTTIMTIGDTGQRKTGALNKKSHGLISCLISFSSTPSPSNVGRFKYISSAVRALGCLTALNKGLSMIGVSPPPLTFHPSPSSSRADCKASSRSQLARSRYAFASTSSIVGISATNAYSLNCFVVRSCILTIDPLVGLGVGIRSFFGAICKLLPEKEFSIRSLVAEILYARQRPCSVSVGRITCSSSSPLDSVRTKLFLSKDGDTLR